LCDDSGKIKNAPRTVCIKKSDVSLR
jgi:hypothetical protein